MKKRNNCKEITRNTFCYIMSILCCLFLVLILLELVNIKNGTTDSFYAEDAYFQLEDPNVPSYRINFQLVSSQGKEYKDKSLLVKFKCYDKNGVMVADDVEAKIENGEFTQGIMSYVGSYRSGYDEIVYCELNYVKVN